MIQKLNSFLYTLDLIGTSPQLLIFKSKRYKSIFSSLISILIILASIGFIIYTLFIYISFKNFSIAYSKDNDRNSERSFLLKDLILAFQLVDSIDTLDFNTINDSIGYYQADFRIYYNNGSMFYKSLDIENCEFGNNIDLKNKDLFNNESTYGRSLEEFYCLKTQNTNFSLFYYPNIGFSLLTLYVIYKNNSLFTPEKLQTLIVSENNIIDHNNKDNPIHKGYIFQFTGAYNSLEFTKINYNFRFIKYESDDGLLYKNTTSFKGISFSDMVSYRNNEERYSLNKNNSIIGAIGFVISQSNYDSYTRTYQRLQSLLAEIMSVINLLFEVGRLISNILCNKKMSKDIIENLLDKNKRKLFQNNKINSLLKNNEKKDITSERKDINNETKNISNIDNIEKNDEIKIDKIDKLKENRRVSKIKIIKKVKVNNKIMKNINYYHILKSFLCFDDKKTKLINLCHDIINEDMSIERILERFYNLEKIYKFISNDEKEKFKFIENNKLKEVNKYIYTFINDDIKIDKFNTGEGRNSKNFWKEQNALKENTSIKLNLK